jgi:1-acyl-sn-glycerol-3-phosphate acyltransferase
MFDSTGPRPEGWRRPAAWARAAARGLLFLAVSGSLYLVHRLTVPVLRAAGREGHRWSSRLVRAWARSTARLLGMRVRVEGRPPEPPFLLVANHLGYVDVLVLLARLDGVCVARADAARWPLFGALCRAAGTIFVDRDRARDIPNAAAAIDRALRAGRGVVLFPEGTSSAGETVLPFRPSLLQPAARAGIPVSYASLTYATPPSAPSARQVVCWWGEAPFLPHLARLFSLPGFEATVRFGDETFREPDRKRLAARLERAVRARFRPVPGDPARAEATAAAPRSTASAGGFPASRDRSSAGRENP